MVDGTEELISNDTSLVRWSLTSMATQWLAATALDRESMASRNSARGSLCAMNVGAPFLMLGSHVGQ